MRSSVMTVERYVLAGIAAAALTVSAACGSQSNTVSAAPKPEPLAIATAAVKAVRSIDICE